MKRSFPVFFADRAHAKFLPLLLATVTVAGGCGNDLSKRDLMASKDSIASNRNILDPVNGLDPITGDSESNLSNYVCGSEANIKPDYDWNFNGTGFYTACPARANDTDILVHGRASSGTATETLCFFPAQYYSQTRVIWQPETPQAPFPMVRCVANGATGAYFSFAGTHYNSGFIVPLADAAQMRSCLTEGNYYHCPRNYSFGVFRN